MTYNIIGLGATGEKWDGQGRSIGVNDCWKFGHPTDYLLVFNRPDKFTKERYETIIQSTPKAFVSYKQCWEQEFPDRLKINIKPWYGSLFKGNYYYSDTSTFIAMTFAFNLGAKEIILWGVDFVDHHMYNSNNEMTQREIERYKELVDELELQGCKVYLGFEGSALESFLTVKV